MSTDEDWVPGDALPGWHRMAAHQGFLYNFRECEEAEDCHCPDRAQWPKPLGREVPEEEWFINYFKHSLGLNDG